MSQSEFNTIDCGFNPTLISHGSAGWKPETRVPARLGSGEGSSRLIDGYLLAVSPCGREKGSRLSHECSYKGTNPILGVPPPKTQLPPEGTPSKCHHTGMGASPQGFWEDVNISPEERYYYYLCVCVCVICLSFYFRTCII